MSSMPPQRPAGNGSQVNEELEDFIQQLKEANPELELYPAEPGVTAYIDGVK